jgi:protein TonB
LTEAVRTELEELAWSPPAVAAVADMAAVLVGGGGSAEPAAGGGTAVAQRLEFGEGRGRQPAPVYPREARRERQEGRPGIRFSVDSRGRVSDATVFQPSPWKLLDHAALEAVRRHWRFGPDDAGPYEVYIRFEMGQ